jgi:primosomal protein N' (replication factor Y)
VSRVARVLLDTPLPQLDHLFDYSIPDSLADEAEVGRLVSVPLRGGKRFCDAYVVELVDTSDFSGSLQPIEKVISGLPILQPESLALARRIADRQAGSAIDVLRLLVPPRYVRAEKAFLASLQTATAQSDSPAPFETAAAGWAPGAGERFVVSAEPRLAQLNSGNWVPAWATMFARLAGEQVAQGKSAVLVVPDFRDIESVHAALVDAALGDVIVRTDSAQSGQERYVGYLRSLGAAPVIVLGNRSAALAPASNLGLIALWDDGDDNFVEPLAPYAHARDVSLVRQSMTDAALVLASHSMSTDCARLVAIDYATHVQISHRRPAVIATDLTRDEDASPARIPTAAWLGAKEAIARGPVLVQVASPGFAPALACGQCRERARCQECAGPVAYKTNNSHPSCRWCGSIASKWVCRECGSLELRPIASGSERTADELGRAFPGAQVIVADGNHVITSVPKKPVLVVSTPGAEPLAEGGYAAVVLLDGERMRGRESLRVNEVALRNWSNAVALGSDDAITYLSGSGDVLGAVMQSWSQPNFALEELQDRQALRLPPAVRLVSVSGPSADVRNACDALSDVPSLKVLGPIGISDGASRALVTCDYKVSDQVATILRAEVIQAATRSRRVATRENEAQRVLRLKIRFDDPSIDSF